MLGYEFDHVGWFFHEGFMTSSEGQDTIFTVVNNLLQSMLAAAERVADSWLGCSHVR